MTQEFHESLYVVLFSSDAGVVHNIPTFFDVTLPTNFSLQGGTWGLEIVYLHFHNQILTEKAKTKRVSYFKLYCDEVNSHSNLERSIATLNRPFNNNEPLHYTPTNREIFPLNYNFLQNMIFSLKGFNYLGKQVSFKLLAGQPTVVNIRLVNMTMMLKQPTIPLRMESHSEYNTYKLTNKSNQFKIDCGQMFNLDPRDGRIEAALSQISFIPTFDLPQNRTFTIKVINYNRKKTVKSSRQGTFQIPSEYVNDPYRFVAIVIQVINLTSLSKVNSNHHYTKEEIQKEISFAKINTLKKRLIQMEYHKNKRTVTVTTPNLTTLPVELYMDSILLFALGLTDVAQKVTDDKNFQYKLEFDDKTKSVTGLSKCDPRKLFPDVGFLYCDFINPIPCGNVTSPLLKMFPIKHPTNDPKFTYEYKTEYFNTLDYHEVNKTDLTVMEFSIRDSSGGLIPFKLNKHNVILTLQLRQRRIVS